MIRNFYNLNIKNNLLFLIALMISLYFYYFSDFKYKLNLFEKTHLPITIFANFYFLIFIFFSPILYISGRLSNLLYYIVLITSSALVFTYIIVDYYFYQSFKYHINNFVIRHNESVIWRKIG